MATSAPSINSHTTSLPQKRDFRQEVTDNIVHMLEQGVAPWQKPWSPSENALALPANPTTAKPYRGGNAVHLLATGLQRGYDDPRWMTYKQAADQGWQVRKGEKGSQIEFWEARRSPAKGERPEEPDGKGDGALPGEAPSRLIHRVYTVFNAKQIDGIPSYSPKQHTSFEAVQAGERILAGSGAKVFHDQADRAFYSRAEDSIHLPAKAAFKDASGYYGTALHELAHWSGHPARLNRSTLNESYRFGDLNYAREELRPNLRACFWLQSAGFRMIPLITLRMWAPGSRRSKRIGTRYSGRRTTPPPQWTSFLSWSVTGRWVRNALLASRWPRCRVKSAILLVMWSGWMRRRLLPSNSRLMGSLS